MADTTLANIKAAEDATQIPNTSPAGAWAEFRAGLERLAANSPQASAESRTTLERLLSDNTPPSLDDFRAGLEMLDNRATVEALIGPELLAALNAPQMPNTPQASAMPPTGQDVLSAAQTKNGVTIQKVRLESSDISRFIEIRPPIRRLPNETPMYIEMIDSNYQPCAIQVSDGSIIQALRLAPNPDSMIINSSKIVSKYNTMTRWVETHWGDELDTITFSGSTFSFMAYKSGSSSPGLTVVNRQTTDAYIMLKELIRFYRTNGSLYQDSGTYVPENETSFETANQYSPSVVFLNKYPEFKSRHPRESMIRERLYLRITFDFVSFVGYFETFDFIEDSSSPYRFTYSAIFKSERTKFILG
jgi:hypothetical protein